MNRRDFLSPRQVASTAGQVLDLLNPSPDGPVASPPRPGTILRFARRAMATTFEVLLPFDTPHACEAAEAALDEIDRLEAQLTVYRDSSEVSRLNQLASFTPIRVEDGLFELLQTAKTIHEETGGAHDIAAGALVKVWGFYKGPARVPPDRELAAALARCGMSDVVLDRAHRTVRFLKPGIEINLGSIGKGYALDQAAFVMAREWGIRSGLLHGGNSSLYAIGCAPGETHGWPVGLCHPWVKGRSLGQVWLRDQGLGTSAATFRHLEHEGRKLGHILDPRTGWPAEGMASVSVLAGTATEADALATAFFVLGVERSLEYCETHQNVGAVLLPTGGVEPITINPK